jgi:hypothetical protein
MMTPHRAITERPEVPACGVNSIDDDGKTNGGMYRTQTGQLVSIESDGMPVVIPEQVFSRTRKFWHKKWGKKT